MGQRKVKSGASLGELLNTYTTLNYSWRHALGELVDNSIDSYLEHKDKLPDGIEIRITYDAKGKTLVIQDSAFGMDEAALEAAVQIGKGKKWQKGIGRYGLGLKKAATCLGDEWKVITTQKGNSKKYSVSIDVTKLYKAQTDDLIIMDTKTKNHLHETRIEISKLRKPMRGRTEEYLREHLSEMYRFLISDGQVKIYWNNDLLKYDRRPTRKTTEDDGKQVIWDTPLTLEVKLPGKKETFVEVKGEMYILETMSHTHSGIQLFWGKRMIVGGPRENWRPVKVVGYPEGYKARRFCCALHLDYLDVNHTKDDLLWRKFGKEDLIQALLDSKTVKSFLSESAKAGAASKPDPKVTAKNVKDRLGSKNVTKAVNTERKTSKVKANTLDVSTIEKMVEENGIIFTMDGEPFATQTIMDNAYAPIMTSKVTHQNESGKDVLRILINKGHSYFDIAVNSEAEQELWFEILQGLALTEHTLSGENPPEFDKVIETLGNILKSFRSTDYSE